MRPKKKRTRRDRQSLALIAMLVMMNFRAIRDLPTSRLSAATIGYQPASQPPSKPPGEAPNNFPDLPYFYNQTGGDGDGVGGVILFYHVAKTGGSTIRSFFETIARKNREKYKYRRLHNKLWGHKSNIPAVLKPTKDPLPTCVPEGFLIKHMRDLDQVIHESILGTKIEAADNKTQSKNNRKTLLLEIHGGPPGMDILSSQISKWRELSKSHGTPFFAFTLIREPISFLISYFNFFHVNCSHTWCEHTKYNLTEIDLLKAMASVPNRQCFLLKHLSSISGMDPYFYDQCSVTGEDCRNTYATLTETMDWIGTTEGLSTETIPLLQHILFADKKDERMVKKQKVHDKSSFKESLQESTMQKLRSKTTHDQWIYDEVKARYTSHWLNRGQT